MVRAIHPDGFILKAEAAGAEVKEFKSVEEAMAYVAGFAAQITSGRVVVSRDVIEHFKEAAGLSSLTPKDKDDWTKVEVSLVRADCGVAATGTLVHFDRDDDERLAWTFPSICLCLLPVSNIVPELDALAETIRCHLGRGDLPSPQVSLVTGPSRTADIEGELFLGVHGPGRLVILLVDGSMSPSDEKD
ncbi:MAG: lactate utilization protein [Clostridiales bacterium]|nr:lactate utilization protein [Clostridiales bacterium]